ncbi:glycosyltransferase [Vacuolonema iberomarrocanum]|uniref:glycosyltransferase n=1 Tax=Vacuolonema iberomarrocanum TaxID=3454632 RepID=UPI0019FACB09|nr:glycosyltransferase [filamentous cyanobacterium LEGE 07170]
MRITHISTVDYRGGAGRAMHRLHHGLQQRGHQSERVVRFQDLPDEPAWVVTPQVDPTMFEVIGAAAIQAQAIDQNRTDLSNIFFSFPYPGVDLSQVPAVQAADIVHLHWIVSFQSPVTLKKLLDLGKPVVWTLHDMWAFTGGCHSAAGCTRYQQDCAPCPLLHQDPHHLPAAVLRDKLELLRSPNLTIVTPSHQMAEKARQSQLFRDMPIHVIPNSVDTEVFVPLPKDEAKQTVGLPVDGLAIAFGAEFLTQRSKGGPELIDTLQQCLQDAPFKTLAEEGKLHLIGLGHPDPQLAEALGVPLLECGFVDSEARLRELYAAADVFLQPSLEESFGNMAIEAMSCGTPVIAFAVGIAPEVIETDRTGRVIPLGDTEQMAAAVLDWVHHPDKWRAMSEKCRDLAACRFSQDAQAAAYAKLYDSLLAGLPQTSDASVTESPTEITTLSWDLALGSGVRLLFSPLALESLPPYVQALQTQVVQSHKAHRQLQDDHQQMRDKHHQLLDKQKELRQKLQNQQALKQKLTNLRNRVQYGEDTVEQLHSQLAQTRDELTQVQEELAAIKSSTFWKTREVWHRLKVRLGLKSL